MTLDPKRPEDAEKIDADSMGRGGDDYYDENRYALMSRPLPLKVAKAAPDKQPHQALPLVVKDGKLVKPVRPPKTIEELVDRAEQHSARLPHSQRSSRRRYS